MTEPSYEGMLKSAATDMKNASLDQLYRRRAKAAARLRIIEARADVFNPEDIEFSRNYLHQFDHAIRYRQAMIEKSASLEFVVEAGRSGVGNS